MRQAIKEWTPEDQRVLFWGVVFVWLSSLLFVLFSGGKLGLILFIITTLITGYLLALTRWSGINDIQGERQLYPSNNKIRFETGDVFHVKTFFKIPGFWPIPYVLVRDEVNHHRIGTKTYESSFVPNFYRSGEIAYTISDLKRGSYHFAATACSTGDLLNLFEHKSTLQLPLSFKVHPRTVDIHHWPYVLTLRKAISYATTLKFQKETTEIDGVREFVQGERLSKIHWNASAKTGELKSKEFVRESVSKVIVIIDQFRDAYQNDVQFELAVSTAASIIRYISRRNMPVGLFSPGKQLTYFEPKPGLSYRNRLEDYLVYVNMDGKMMMEEALLDQRIKRLQGSILLVITPTTSESLFHRLQWLKRMNLHPCHLWLTRTNGQEANKWQRRLKTEKIIAYPFDTLKTLPVVLGRERL